MTYCNTCKYSKPHTEDPLRGAERVTCRRYPEHKVIHQPHWCGEYTRKPKPRSKK